MLRNASELFYDIPAKIKDDQKHAISHLESDNVNELIKYLHENEVGKDQSFLGPFGWRKIGKYIDFYYVLGSANFLKPVVT